MLESVYLIAQIGHEFSIYVLAALSLFSVTFILERYLFISPILKESQRIEKEIYKQIESNDFSKIEKLSDKNNFFGQLIQVLISHFEKHGLKGAQEVFEVYHSIKKGKLLKHLNFLATVTSNAPFIGLLGTVFGVMEAFKELSVQSDPSLVLASISKALIATALGLLVAIPSGIFYNFFLKRVKNILDQMESLKKVTLTSYKIKS